MRYERDESEKKVKKIGIYDERRRDEKEWGGAALLAG
jgi:hypothetical protein